MRAIEGELMLTAWERCRGQNVPQSAVALMGLACPEQSHDVLIRLPLVQRNAELLKARRLTFGRRMTGFAVCPDCGAQLEFELDADELAASMDSPAAVDWPDVQAPAPRPADTADLIACLEANDRDEACEILMNRTLGLAKTDDKAELDVRLEFFESLNASAEIRLRLQCASCGQIPEIDLDIAQFFVKEIRLAARELIGEVHALAKAYGWSESSIAEMSPVRRAAYLELLDA